MFFSGPDTISCPITTEGKKEIPVYSVGQQLGKVLRNPTLNTWVYIYDSGTTINIIGYVLFEKTGTLWMVTCSVFLMMWGTAGFLTHFSTGTLQSP